MKVRELSAVCAFSLAFIVAPLLARAESKFSVDPVHSSVVFKIKHMDVSYVFGRFIEPTGTFTVDSDDPTKSSFALEIPAKNVDTSNAKRDEHLKGPDFFNVKQFPTITFKSTSVKKGDDDKTMEVTGDLTLHGVTKPITVKVQKVGEKEMPAQMGGGTRAGIEGEVTIKRSDFGMTGMIGPVGDEVKLMIGLEGKKE